VFDTGAVRDRGGKEDYVETVSFSALKRFAEYMTAKKEVYGEGNWRKGIPIESYEESLFRHVQKYFANKYEGAGLEPETDHLAGAFFNLQGIMHEEERARRAASITHSATTSGGSIVLANLPSKSEAIVTDTAVVRVLRKMGYKNTEIANMTGVSERTVYRRLAGGN
jgi:DNA-directed RNA polymerase specialized sigma24 family protein